MAELLIRGPDDALETANFFLIKIRELWSKIQESWPHSIPIEEKELRHYLFAFVVSVTIIPDYLLHEYTIKYVAPERRIEDKLMKMRFLDRLDPRFMYNFCKLKKNEACKRFLKVWMRARDKLRSDKEMRMMFRVRNGAVHHKMITNPHFLTIKPIDGTPKVMWSWGEDDEEIEEEPIIIPDVISFCEQFYIRMKMFLDEFRKDFGY